MQSKASLATARGTLSLGGPEMDCYILDTGERVIGLTAMAKCICMQDPGQIKEMLKHRALSIDDGMIERESCSFVLPDHDSTAQGISSHGFLLICRTLFVALAQGELTTRREREMALHCAAILSGCADVGLAALIDEATGAGNESDD